MKISINGKVITYAQSQDSYAAIDRQWKKGDVISIMLPMKNTIEYLPHVSSYIAFMHGPILLAARGGATDLKGLVADDSRWGHIASGERLPVDKAPIIIEDDIKNVASKLVPLKDKPLTYTLPDEKMLNAKTVVLEPFYRIHDERYMMYWMALSNSQHKAYIDSIAMIEKQKLALQKRTVDFVAPGEQQPEVDHAMQKENSRTGNNLNEFWRDASADGYFSYSLTTNGKNNLSLMVRYWGAEWGSRKFDIYVDDQKLVTEDNTGRWNQSRFFDVEYNIPDAMTQGKEKIRVKFQALPKNTAGAVYYVRLVGQE